MYGVPFPTGEYGVWVHPVRPKTSSPPIRLTLESCSQHASFAREQLVGYFKEVGQIARTFWLSMPLVEELLLLCVTSMNSLALGHSSVMAQLPVLSFICLLGGVFWRSLSSSKIFADFLLGSTLADHSPYSFSCLIVFPLFTSSPINWRFRAWEITSSSSQLQQLMNCSSFRACFHCRLMQTERIKQAFFF